jgi:hypothetical protein
MCCQVPLKTYFRTKKKLSLTCVPLDNVTWLKLNNNQLNSGLSSPDYCNLSKCSQTKEPKGSPMTKGLNMDTQKLSVSKLQRPKIQSDTQTTTKSIQGLVDCSV